MTTVREMCERLVITKYASPVYLDDEDFDELLKCIPWKPYKMIPGTPWGANFDIPWLISENKIYDFDWPDKHVKILRLAQVKPLR